MKKVQQHSSAGKCKLKPQWDITFQLAIAITLEELGLVVHTVIPVTQEEEVEAS
jgi:hypothetical protein